MYENRNWYFKNICIEDSQDLHHLIGKNLDLI